VRPDVRPAVQPAARHHFLPCSFRTRLVR
jgi:hypothetical protein